MSEIKHFVMVASLERHLRAERDALFEALMAQGCVPTGLPFPAVSANYLWKLNQLAINDADYVFLLVGREYGPLSEQGVGYLHQAYAAARARQIPVVAFLYDGDAKPVLSDIDQTRLSELEGQLRTGLNYRWHNEETLRDAAERAIEQLIETHPRPGWCRATASGGQHQELERLRDELTRLKQSLSAEAGAQPADLSLLTDDQSRWHTTFNCKAFREGQLRVVTGNLSLPWRTLFDWLAASLMAPTSETRVYALLGDCLQPLALQEVQRDWPGTHAVSDVRPERAAFDQLKLRLRSAGLVGFDGQGRWRLTGAGERAALQSMADARADE